MKFFFAFFLAATALCAAFWYHDGPDSGMDLATGIFTGLTLGVGVYNTVVNGGPLKDGKSQ